MGLFSRNRSFDRSQNYSWNRLDSIEQLDKIDSDSEGKPIILFKHSTRCGVSSMALDRVQKDWPVEEGTADAYLLDLLAYRNISNEIAERYNVVHQSPQVLIIKGGECTYNASHAQIDSSAIRKEL